MCSFCRRLQSIFVLFFAVPETRWWCRTSGKPPQLHIERSEESPRSAVLAYVPFYLDPWGAGENLTQKLSVFKICIHQLQWATDMKSIFKMTSVLVDLWSNLDKIYSIWLHSDDSWQWNLDLTNLYNEALGLTNDLLRRVHSKICENESQPK